MIEKKTTRIWLGLVHNHEQLRANLLATYKS